MSVRANIGFRAAVEVGGMSSDRGIGRVECTT